MMFTMWPTIAFNTPGLFITGTDTEVGKTVVSCAIARALRLARPGAKVGALKPFATGCRKDRGELVNEDAEALAHFSDCRLPLATINPIRFRDPLAPATAAQQQGEAIDWSAVQRAAREVDDYADAVLVEGAGGVMVPLDPARPEATWLETRCFGLPAVVVTRPNLGTLNHTAMTVRVLREAGVSVAGIVVNGYEADAAAAMSRDPSLPSNPKWMQAMTGAKVLALVPRAGERVDASKGVLPSAVLDTVAAVDWWELCRSSAG